MCNLSDRIEEKGCKKGEFLTYCKWLEKEKITKQEALEELNLTEEEFDRKRAELLLNI